MDRRSSLKLLLLAAATPRHLWGAAPAASFESAWRDWPSMRWVGPEYWGNRLQDWALEDGTASCRLLAPNRTLHCLTHRVTSEEGFTTSVSVDPSCLKGQGTDAIVGFRLGINGTTDDVRNAAVHGKGIDVGINAMGGLVIGGTPLGDVILPLDDQYRLECSVVPSGSNALVTVTATGRFSTSLGASLPAHRLLGNVALLSHAPKATGTPGATFADWRIEGPGLTENADATFGPIMFAQYTVHRGTLKLTAQLAPIDTIPGVRAALDVRQPSGEWATVATAPIDPLARTTRFRVEGWDTSVAKPYRIRLDIPLAGGVRSFRYDGTIAAEPSNRPVKAAIFSCNADFGFPDDEVVRHVQAHDADLAVFLGDQYYESSGGFGIEHDTIEGATLDMLHKWYMFGWSYRDIFRHIPSGCIPDDHDVYHGNVWGEGGHAAPLDKGWGAPAQDRGGYKMWPEWINAMQMAQTSNLPDPYDPTPVDQGIGVYYTRWDYGGVSFAILEDRKFKSAPANVLPAEAKVYNGWLQNPDFDIRQHRDIDATLLGERQMRFLADWAADWSRSYLKVVFSQTNWAAVHTIPASAMSGDVIPSLPLPEPGEVVTGDKCSVDMDTNGWPAKRRDEVLRLLRRCSAFHIAGDQHLATMVRHGVDDWGDACFSFTGPALNNLWPRRWWPPESARAGAPGDGPVYTGRFRDGFDNRITVLAAANPRNAHARPEILRNRVTGYGMVILDPRSGRIRIECWPRQVPPSVGDGGQYEGWPIEIDGRGGDGRRPVGYLPALRVSGLTDPVVQLLDAQGELVYARRVVGGTATLPVFAPGSHTLRVGDPDRDVWQERTIAEREWGRGEMAVHFP